MRRGTRLADNKVIAKIMAKSQNWRLCQTFTEDTVLCVTGNLLDNWATSGLVSRDIFRVYADDKNTFFSISAYQTEQYPLNSFFLSHQFFFNKSLASLMTPPTLTTTLEQQVFIPSPLIHRSTMRSNLSILFTPFIDTLTFAYP